MKKMKEFAAIFSGIFTHMVKDQMVSSNNDLKVLEFGNEYPEQLQTLSVLKSAAKYQQILDAEGDKTEHNGSFINMSSSSIV